MNKDNIKEIIAAIASIVFIILCIPILALARLIDKTSVRKTIKAVMKGEPEE